MNLQEELEKAFKAGADFMAKYTLPDDYPNEEETEKAIINYINKVALSVEIKD